MIVAGPVPSAVAMPVVGLIESMPEALLVQLPPVVESAYVVVDARHIVPGPVMEDGDALTPNDAVTKHPLGAVYVMVPVPGARPP